MAKKKEKIKGFELEETPTNPAKVQSAFDDLEQFIESELDFPERSKHYLHSIVKGHRGQTGLKVAQDINAAHLNSAIEKINNLLNK